MVFMFLNNKHITYQTILPKTISITEKLVTVTIPIFILGKLKTNSTKDFMILMIKAIKPELIMPISNDENNVFVMCICLKMTSQA